MHVLAIESGALDTGEDAVDLGQSAGDIVVLSAADTELTLLAHAYRARADLQARASKAQTSPQSQAPGQQRTPGQHEALGQPLPTLRLANLMALRHNYSVDLYVEATLSAAKLIVLRVLGGRAYFAYGLERIAALCRDREIRLAVLPGDDKADPTLEGLSTIADDQRYHLWRCLCEGGAINAERFLDGCAALLDDKPIPLPPQPIPRATLYASMVPESVDRDGVCEGDGRDSDSNGDCKGDDTGKHNGRCIGRAAVVFYRALLQSGDTGAVDAMMAALVERGLAVDAFAVQSLRDTTAAALLTERFSEYAPDIVINTTAFASGTTETDPASVRTTVFGCDAIWLQAVLSSQTKAAWEANEAGLAIRDVAMHVSLPEFDGRVLTRAVAFKADQGRDPLTEWPITTLEADGDRTDHLADLATAWVRLRRTPRHYRRVAIILANYPNRDGRIANGVGLATPASVAAAMSQFADSGYALADVPADGDALIEELKTGPTNATHRQSPETTTDTSETLETLPLADYETWFANLPNAARAEVTARWGPPGDDAMVHAGAFALAVRRYGNVVVGIQPARGYNIDPKETYHDPALVPPHGYLAFYLWLRKSFAAHAVVHFGKHGNLEWLPGKALALSGSCWPDIALGDLPNIYPFIVNDPGEGSQAKRRTSAVILDHLTPPLTRAETYGPLKDLEALVDEYYEAQAVDARRSAKLVQRILDEATRIGLAEDSGIAADDGDAVRLQKLDAYLCDLKEMQIRGGLHVFGVAPDGVDRTDLLAALVRVPRGPDADQASLQRAIATDLQLSENGFDPLDCTFSDPWHGPRPDCLERLLDAPWRTNGDTVERIEILTAGLLCGEACCEPSWPRTMEVLASVQAEIAPRLDQSASCERTALLTALDGRIVPPGAAGAPTRGRIDVLPTGRNFYSLDSRSLPTETAWEIGRKAADAFVTRYVQDHGEWPRAIAMSAWGTSNMRTGGDDLAQVLALLGAQPTWEGASRRVTGFEILPIAQLGRPRVDVTLRISGFFRDAFPAQIALIDSVVRAVVQRDERPQDNPLRARALSEQTTLEAAGVAPVEAARRASFRVFGSKPGAYGAGLQAMFDERLWEDDADLADAFLEWGQYAYGSDTSGKAERGLIETRLRSSDAVLHNQDNREHDILDSDDYYQFAGGLAVAVRDLKGGKAVPVYHGDNARPERPIVRALDEEIARVVRARAVNPKWIAAMMRHGYKGAFEMSATVDYLFAFAATTKAVRDHHFDAVFEAYLEDDVVRTFLGDKSPDALADIQSKLQEAIDRELWTPRRNSVRDTLRSITAGPTVSETGDET